MFFKIYFWSIYRISGSRVLERFSFFFFFLIYLFVLIFLVIGINLLGFSVMAFSLRVRIQICEKNNLVFIVFVSRICIPFAIRRFHVFIQTRTSCWLSGPLSHTNINELFSDFESLERSKLYLERIGFQLISQIFVINGFVFHAP